jgi:hypothetical protein
LRGGVQSQEARANDTGCTCVPAITHYDRQPLTRFARLLTNARATLYLEYGQALFLPFPHTPSLTRTTFRPCQDEDVCVPKWESVLCSCSVGIDSPGSDLDSWGGGNHSLSLGLGDWQAKDESDHALRLQVLELAKEVIRVLRVRTASCGRVLPICAPHLTKGSPLRV